MKHVNWRYVAGGFVAGVVFVASCGQGVRSTAEAVLAALDISFDHSGTGLSATDVQGAIEELDSRAAGGGSWLLKDKNGVTVFEAPRPDKCGNSPFDIMQRPAGYNASLDKCIYLDGTYYVWGFFAAADCTGQPYMEVAADGYVGNIGFKQLPQGYSLNNMLFPDRSVASTSFLNIATSGAVASNFSYAAYKCLNCSTIVCTAGSGSLGKAQPVTPSWVTVPFEFPFTGNPGWSRN